MVLLPSPTADDVGVDAAASWSFDALCRHCRADAALVTALVHEGVLSPTGHGPADWRFDATMLQRTRTAMRLARGLRANVEAIALVLDLRDEIDTLRARLAAPVASAESTSAGVGPEQRGPVGMSGGERGSGSVRDSRR